MARRTDTVMQHTEVLEQAARRHSRLFNSPSSSYYASLVYAVRPVAQIPTRRVEIGAGCAPAGDFCSCRQLYATGRVSLPPLCITISWPYVHCLPHCCSVYSLSRYFPSEPLPPFSCPLLLFSTGTSASPIFAKEEEEKEAGCCYHLYYFS
ncbi:hypothetical protein TRVL_01266 [Trypanosoma vivax]|uniref:Uncharacterized protein n=1 Tax=Trypanosoma vivax (strain Y486) TaxID=1055687 RepID=G0TUY6_TRYVY|nr:hypothetical protein TRVL_01266 [Trypanosoma vivax]CCC47773.1 hypothetical protein TVY486_0404410 [Trypanosoma vivax Y486]